jgi:hypothetical protein
VFGFWILIPMDKELLLKILGLAKTYWLWILIAVIGGYYALGFLGRFFRFMHLHFIAKRLVYLKITLPRSDSKIDQEKRTEKDFKEKVAVMAQLYRALYEIRELNLWNLIKTKIWQADNISFELFVEKQELYFYVVVSKDYESIVEKQITTFYKDADVKITRSPYDLFEKGKKYKS